MDLPLVHVSKLGAYVLPTIHGHLMPWRMFQAWYWGHLCHHALQALVSSCPGVICATRDTYATML